jgi:transposase
MMVALLLYGYAIGERSSRRLERRCVEDVATRVICANQAPDHSTIARFRQRHEARWPSCSARCGRSALTPGWFESE